MALSHLLDSSVLTHLHHPAVREAIELPTERGELARAGISDLEIGYSARNATEWDWLEEALRAFELVETTAEHVRRAKQVQRMLAAKHQRGRKVPDLLIAAAAESRASCFSRLKQPQRSVPGLFPDAVIASSSTMRRPPFGRPAWSRSGNSWTICCGDEQ